MLIHTSPNSLRRGPPELPGLIAASVWIKFTFLFGIPTSAAERDKEETMPKVTWVRVGVGVRA